MGKLFIVATPIGNLKDITLRAIDTLCAVDYIASEDTRKIGFLLKELSKFTSKAFTKPKFISYYEYNEQERIPYIVQLLKDGSSVALVSDAGTPLISDPGFKLVRECIKEKIPVEVIPGPSAVIAALTVSGFPPDKFLFLGYLPKSKLKRQNFLKSLNLTLSNMKKSIEPTVILYESPYRLIQTLKDIYYVFGDIQILICRELTKLHEEIRRERITDSIKHFEEFKPKGEITLLLSLK